MYRSTTTAVLGTPLGTMDECARTLHREDERRERERKKKMHREHD